MQPTSSSPPGATDVRSDESLVRGLVVGVVPLALVAAVVALFLVVEMLVGHLTAGQDFFTAQRIAVIVLIVGMIATIATYAVSCRVALRRIVAWQAAGDQAPARGALLGLALTALVVLLPVLLAVFVPQHPAP